MNTQKFKDILKDPKTNWKYIGVVAFLGLIVGVGIYVCQSKYKFEFEIPTIKIPEKINETANWKTYRNEEYGYEIRYPKDWYLYSSNPADVFLQPEEEMPGAIPGPHADALEIEVSSISSDTTLAELIKDKVPQNFTQEEVAINEMGGLKIKTICEGVGCGIPHWFVIKGTHLYHFDSNLGYEPIFEKILSTFRFVDRFID